MWGKGQRAECKKYILSVDDYATEGVEHLRSGGWSFKHRIFT
jgi:hypothetical protein